MSRIFTRSMLVISLVALIMALILHFQGPRAVSFKESGSLATKNLTIGFNTPLNMTKQPNVSVQPSASHTVTLTSRTVIIRFDEPLKADTTYIINVDSIYDRRGKKTRLVRELETRVQRIAYLERNQSGDDAIYEKAMASNQKRLLFKAPQIGDFARGAGNSLLTIIEQNDRSILVAGIKEVTPLSLPKGEPVKVEGIRTSKRFIIQTRDRTTFQNYLFLYDAANDTFKEVTKKDGSPIHAARASFAADGKTIVYQDATDTTLYIDDPLDTRDALNLGQVSEFIRFMPDNSGIFVQKRSSDYGTISASDASYFPAETSSRASNVIRFINGKTLFIYNDFSNARLQQKVFVDELQLTESSSDNTAITGLSLSSNDEFAAVESAPEPVVYDESRISQKPKNVLTILYSTEGSFIETLNGSHIQWL